MQRLIAVTLFATFLTASTASAQITPPQPVDSDLAYLKRVEERLSGVDYQMQGLTGQVEQLQFRLRQAETRIKKLNAELAEVKAEQASTPPALVQASDTSSNSIAQVGLPTGNAQVKYDEAQGLLRVGRYEQAESAFVAFRKSFPDHSLAANAHYWMGEAQYHRQRFQEAATTFLEAWKSDIQGPKAPDNLYKFGKSMQARDKKDEACASFAKVLSDYRDAPKRLRDKVLREQASLKCS